MPDGNQQLSRDCHDRFVPSQARFQSCQLRFPMWMAVGCLCWLLGSSVRFFWILRRVFIRQLVFSLQVSSVLYKEQRVKKFAHHATPKNSESKIA
jgi:hypothetical protein